MIKNHQYARLDGDWKFLEVTASAMQILNPREWICIQFSSK